MSNNYDNFRVHKENFLVDVLVSKLWDQNSPFW